MLFPVFVANYWNRDVSASRYNEYRGNLCEKSISTECFISSMSGLNINQNLKLIHYLPNCYNSKFKGLNILSNLAL